MRQFLLALIFLCLSCLIGLSGSVSAYTSSLKDYKRLVQAKDSLQAGNKTKALELFKKLAEQGNPRAMYYSGLAFDEGWQEKSMKKALVWYEKSAQANDPKGQYKLGMAYLEGRHVKKSEVEAVMWLKRSARQGYAPAQVALGRLYLKKSYLAGYDSAVKWLRSAVENEHPVGAYLLAKSLEKGRGTVQDLEKAEELYNRAAKKGVEKAKKRLSRYKNAEGTLSLFGVPMILADREMMRAAVDKAGVRTKTALDSKVCDTYDPERVFYGASRLACCFNPENSRLGVLYYAFSDREMDKTMEQVFQPVAKKYGTPSNVIRNDNGYPATIRWREGGIGIQLKRREIDGRNMVTLEYRVPGQTKSLQDKDIFDLDRQNRNSGHRRPVKQRKSIAF